jgi:hypothetical protein
MVFGKETKKVNFKSNGGDLFKFAGLLRKS